MPTPTLSCPLPDARRWPVGNKWGGSMRRSMPSGLRPRTVPQLFVPITRSRIGLTGDRFIDPPILPTNLIKLCFEIFFVLFSPLFCCSAGLLSVCLPWIFANVLFMIGVIISLCFAYFVPCCPFLVFLSSLLLFQYFVDFWIQSSLLTRRSSFQFAGGLCCSPGRDALVATRRPRPLTAAAPLALHDFESTRHDFAGIWRNFSFYFSFICYSICRPYIINKSRRNLFDTLSAQSYSIPLQDSTQSYWRLPREASSKNSERQELSLLMHEHNPVESAVVTDRCCQIYGGTLPKRSIERNGIFV